MAAPTPSFSDRVAVVAAELAELGKRPVSPDTHPKLVALYRRLDRLVSEFVACDRCGNLFPSVAQLTLDGRSANVCTSCGITALQKGVIELRGGRGTSARGRSTRPMRAGRPSRTEAQPSAGEPVAEGEEDQVATGQLPSEQGEEAGVAAATESRPGVAAGHLAPDGEPSSAIEGVTPGQESAKALAYESAEAAPPVPRRTAKRPQSDESVFKATVPEVAKHLKRAPQEVRLIGKLIEEISPPMDTEKTTRYVLAELRNTRSKIPVDIVPHVVATLKEGIPGGEE